MKTAHYELIFRCNGLDLDHCHLVILQGNHSEAFKVLADTVMDHLEEKPCLDTVSVGDGSYSVSGVNGE